MNILSVSLLLFALSVHGASANSNNDILSDWNEISKELNAFSVENESLSPESCARYDFGNYGRSKVRSLELQNDEFPDYYVEKIITVEDFKKLYNSTIKSELFENCLSDMFKEGKIRKSVTNQFKKLVFQAADKAKRIVKIMKWQDDAYIYYHFIFYLDLESGDESSKISFSIGSDL